MPQRLHEDEARSLAPDLARGFMLLLIALAHAPLLLYQLDLAQMSWWDAQTARLRYLLVEHRAFAMFAFLFGYGLWQFASRRLAAGDDWPTVQVLLRRRGLWLIGLGMVHVVVLFRGDILAGYGLTILLLLVLGLLRADDKTVLQVAGLCLLLAAATGWARGDPSWAAPSTESTVQAFIPSAAQENLWLAVVDRLQEWSFSPVSVQAVALPAVLFGVWAARRRFLEEPQRHRRLLQRVAVFGLTAGVLGGVPSAWLFPQLWTEAAAGTAAASAAATVQTLTGYAGGIGVAALVGLSAIKLDRRRGPVTTAVQALGQRTLTFYLFQSAVFVVAFAPYGFGLGGTLSLWQAGVFAAGVWLTCVAGAELLRRAGVRGPAESLLRGLVYRPVRRRQLS